jgi:hypothetical protein
MEKARSRMVKRVSPLKMTDAASGFAPLTVAASRVDAAGACFKCVAADSGSTHRIPRSRGAATSRGRRVLCADNLMTYSDYRAEGSSSRLNPIIF